MSKKNCEHESKHPLYRRERVADLPEERIISARKAGRPPYRGMIVEDSFEEGPAWLCETCKRLVTKDGELLNRT